MTRRSARTLAAALLAAAVGTACAGGAPRAAVETAPRPEAGAPQGEAAAIARARADSARNPWTAADARFMTMMIGHHAQAIEMARMAPTHGASAAVRTLAERIINAQQDEIVTMQQWLRDRRQPVPEPVPTTDAGHGSGHAHHARMPGMLTAEQMRELDAARGLDFDRLFLRYMIQHHRGAVEMVRELFAQHGAAQDETVFKFASDVNVDQTTEITRMQQMLLVVEIERASQ